MKSANISNKFGGIKYKFIDGLNNNKKACFCIIIVCLIGVLTGVFTAINYCNGQSLINFNDYSICKFISGQLGTLDLFFSRFFSYTLVLTIIWVSSLSVYLFPVSLFVLAYRGYLLSLNVSIMIILYGVNGIVTGVFVILPVHLVGLILLSCFACYCFKKAYLKSRFGSCNFNLWDKYLIFLLLLTILNLIETLLLTIFSGKSILVI
ncbi:MAG: hypothetical protein J5779_02365 [Clostridia bacterium]|nr:hypothetical protein [Clostridia bacterium]